MFEIVIEGYLELVSKTSTLVLFPFGITNGPKEELFVSLFLVMSLIASNGLSIREPIDSLEFVKFEEWIEWFNTFGIRAGRVPFVGANDGDDGSDDEVDDEHV